MVENMEKEHNHWFEYWVNTKNPPIYKNPPSEAYGGTNYEPLASIGMSCFTDAVRDDFKENFSIIDYGCGAGILSNFISERLDNFKYFGLEPSTGWGPGRIETGKRYFNDERVKFGFVEDYNEIIKNNKIDTVILISVFTHLVIEDCLKILDNLKNIFDYNKDASIVFSCFSSDTPRVSGLQSYINSNYYGDSYIKLSDLQNYTDVHNLTLTKHMDFIAMGGWKHEIFKITKV
jgi:SAM-dependent methyltransferase